MTCHTHIDAGVAARLQYAALDLALANEARAFTPASSTSRTLTVGGANAMIANRAKQMQFRSNEARKRYLAIHRTLATAICSGVHDGR
jgi:hypothetical protein